MSNCAPEPGIVFWADTTILPAPDAAPWCAVVVLDAPRVPAGTVAVVARSTVDSFGIAHPAGDGLGFTVPGRFSRRYPVLAALWSPDTVTAVGSLDGAVFARVVARFAP